jgi:hypothetical protein
MSVERTRVIGARCCSNAVDEPVRATAKEEEGKAVKRKGCAKWSGHTARSDAEVLGFGLLLLLPPPPPPPLLGLSCSLFQKEGTAPHQILQNHNHETVSKSSTTTLQALSDESASLSEPSNFPRHWS